MMLKTSRLWVVLLVAVLAGCSSTGGSKDGGVAVEDRSTGGAGADSGAVTSGTGASSTFDRTVLDDPDSPLARRVIYFDYDSAEISAADQDTLLAHAAVLVAYPDQVIVLEGHTDERGSREYNIALGDRRGLSVQRILELNGVQAGQASVVSYGEEKSAAEGHSEAAWRLNRRVEIVYQ